METAGVLLIYFVISFTVCIICGLISKAINIGKGYDGGFAWGFFLGILGIIVVAIRPHVPVTQENVVYGHNAYSNVQEFEDIDEEDEMSEPGYKVSEKWKRVPSQQHLTWLCEYCNTENDEINNYCVECGKMKPKEWFCVNCGGKNTSKAKYCAHCGQRKAEM